MTEIQLSQLTINGKCPTNSDGSKRCLLSINQSHEISFFARCPDYLSAECHTISSIQIWTNIQRVCTVFEKMNVWLSMYYMENDLMVEDGKVTEILYFDNIIEIKFNTGNRAYDYYKICIFGIPVIDRAYNICKVYANFKKCPYVRANTQHANNSDANNLDAESAHLSTDDAIQQREPFHTIKYDLSPSKFKIFGLYDSLWFGLRMYSAKIMSGVIDTNRDISVESVFIANQVQANTTIDISAISSENENICSYFDTELIADKPKLTALDNAYEQSQKSNPRILIELKDENMSEYCDQPLDGLFNCSIMLKDERLLINNNYGGVYKLRDPLKLDFVLQDKKMHILLNGCELVYLPCENKPKLKWSMLVDGDYVCDLYSYTVKIY